MHQFSCLLKLCCAVDSVVDWLRLSDKLLKELSVPKLCGFKRIFVKKGEKLDVEIEIPDKAFTTVSDIGERKQFAKEFTLYVGTHQPDELSCQLSGTNCMSIEIER